MPLIRFLLKKGADPSIKNSFALEIAVTTRDLSIVRLLLDRDSLSDGLPGSHVKGKKKRRLSSSVIDPRFVEMAMRKGAMDVVEYFVHEKGKWLGLPDVADSKGSCRLWGQSWTLRLSRTYHLKSRHW